MVHGGQRGAAGPARGETKARRRRRLAKPWRPIPSTRKGRARPSSPPRPPPRRDRRCALRRSRSASLRLTRIEAAFAYRDIDPLRARQVPYITGVQSLRAVGATSRYERTVWLVVRGG